MHSKEDLKNVPESLGDDMPPPLAEMRTEAQRLATLIPGVRELTIEHPLFSRFIAHTMSTTPRGSRSMTFGEFVAKVEAGEIGGER